MKGDSLSAIINSKSIFALHALQEHWWKQETSPTLEITYWCSEKKGEKKNMNLQQGVAIPNLG